MKLFSALKLETTLAFKITVSAQKKVEATFDNFYYHILKI